LSTDLEIFKHRLYDEWLPAYCKDDKREYSTAGFKPESIKISEYDAVNFMRALDSGFVIDSGGGRYRCERSNALEVIFWEGSKSLEPRPISLWLEPVITIGTIARLGLDYGWPEKCLCMQSKDYAFDFAVFKSKSNENEYVAGEVKKTSNELDKLISNLKEFGKLGAIECDSDNQNRINSFKKWVALLRCKAPLFWAVGPNNYTYLFSVEYNNDNTATFAEVELGQLRAPESVFLMEDQ
jgi:hypothetical protein